MSFKIAPQTPPPLWIWILAIIVTSAIVAMIDEGWRQLYTTVIRPFIP